jgi:hypothetical protein
MRSGASQRPRWRWWGYPLNRLFGGCGVSLGAAWGRRGALPRFRAAEPGRHTRCRVSLGFWAWRWRRRRQQKRRGVGTPGARSRCATASPGSSAGRSRMTGLRARACETLGLASLGRRVRAAPSLCCGGGRAGGLPMWLGGGSCCCDCLCFFGEWEGSRVCAKGAVAWLGCGPVAQQKRRCGKRLLPARGVCGWLPRGRARGGCVVRGFGSRG